MKAWGSTITSRIPSWVWPAPPKDDPLRQAIAEERAAIFGWTARLRAGGALLVLAQVVLSWIVTGEVGWLVSVSPLTLYTVCACLLVLLRERGPVASLTWGAAVLDVCGVFVVQQGTLPVSPYPAGVAGFSLGLFALVLVLNSLCMSMGASLSAAAAAGICQVRLMAEAHVSAGSMSIGVTTLFLVVWASHAGVWRVHLLAARALRTEAARLAEARRADELTAARDRIQTMLAEAEHKHELLRHAQQDRDELARLLVHDLRNPLTTLTISLESLDEQLRRAGAISKWQGAVQRSIQSTSRLGNMVTDMLDVARLEEGQMRVNKTRMAVPDIIPPGWSDGPMDPLREIKRSLDVPPGFTMLADRELMTRVVENLLGNAERYVRLGNRILFEAREDDEETVISVHNDGYPVPAELREKVFDRFFRGPGATQRGWGLGLCFCKLAVEAHGGRIAIEDVPGWAVSFVVRLRRDRSITQASEGLTLPDAVVR